jgi:hypothetical protein
MQSRQLTPKESAQIGGLLSAVVVGLLFVLWPASLSFSVFATNAVVVLFLFGLAGALFGGYVLKTRTGAWIGAISLILVLSGWLYVIAATSPLE